jgi:general secretion pathway protein K
MQGIHNVTVPRSRLPKARRRGNYSDEAAEEDGFALLIVLWSLVFLSLLCSQIVYTGRLNILLAGNVYAQNCAQTEADGAIYEALFRLSLKGSDHWGADGTEHVIHISPTVLAVRMSTLDGKINPNLASVRLLDCLFLVLGANRDRALQIATSIVEWRTPAENAQSAQARLVKYRNAGLPYGPSGQDFTNVNDLADVLGMQPALLTRALPHLSLLQSTNPDPAKADDTVRKALVLSGTSNTGGPAAIDPPPVVKITAVAIMTDRLYVQRTAYVSIDDEGNVMSYKIIAMPQ